MANNTRQHQPVASFTNFPAKKIKRVDKKAVQEEKIHPAVQANGTPKKNANVVRESIMSVDRQLLANPLNVARHCKAIFNFYLEQEVHS
jgi:hypothetical protein